MIEVPSDMAPHIGLLAKTSKFLGSIDSDAVGAIVTTLFGSDASADPWPFTADDLSKRIQDITRIAGDWINHTWTSQDRVHFSISVL